MTSTSFNVGLSETKNSSKVIKPPGGGHSDIFGIHGNANQIVTPSKRRHPPVSTITCCFQEEEEVPKPITTPKDEIDNDAAKNGNKELTEAADENIEPKTDESKDEAKQPAQRRRTIIERTKQEQKATDENTKPKKDEAEDEVKPKTETRRVRVPPGGYSTALW